MTTDIPLFLANLKSYWRSLVFFGLFLSILIPNFIGEVYFLFILNTLIP